MAITAITGGTVVVHIKVDYTAADLAEINTEVAGNPGTYSEKIFKALDTGLYYYVDADDNVGSTEANTLDPGKSATDGPADLSSGAVDFDISGGNEDNLDLSGLSPNPGTGADGVSILKLTNTSGTIRQIRGIVAPSTSKTMVIYNEGTTTVRLRPENASATAANRFAINANINIAANEGLWVFYDSAAQRWKALNV